MKPRRKFTVAFKQQVAEEVLAGRFTAAQIARKYNLLSSQMSDWIAQYQSGYLGTILDSIENDPAHLRARIAELERMVGKLAVENDALKKTARLSMHRMGASSSVISESNSESAALAKSSGSRAVPSTTKLAGVERFLRTPSVRDVEAPSIHVLDGTPHHPGVSGRIGLA